MSTDKITDGEELHIINEMLARTRRRTAVAGHFFIAWGIVVLLATGIMWVLHHLEQYQYIWVNWLVAMAVGSGYSAWKGLRLEKKADVFTYSDKAVSATWIALCIAFFLVNLIVPLIDHSFEPLLLVNAVLAGCGLFITGILLEIKRFIGYAIVWWAGGIAMAFLDLPNVLGLFMMIIVVGALWPGFYLIRLVKSGD